MKKRQQAAMSASVPKRPPISEMSYEELAAWIRTTRVALQKKLARERAYLDRRAARGTRTPTDDAYEQDQVLEADLISLLDEIAASLAQEGRNG
jgi:hypothetical protein